MRKKKHSAPLMLQPVPAGFPSPAEHYIEKMLDVDEYLAARPESTYYVRVTGDSMIGAGIRPGDVLCVDRSIDFFDGAVVIASVDGEFTVKFLRKEGGRLCLQPANEKYPPIFFDGEQDVRCWGVVTGLVRKFDYRSGRRTVEEPPPRAPRRKIVPTEIKIGSGRRQKYRQDLSDQAES